MLIILSYRICFIKVVCLQDVGQETIIVNSKWVSELESVVMRIQLTTLWC